MIGSRRVAMAHSATADRVYRARNRGGRRIFVYTDSRGFDVTSRRGAVATGSYVGALRKRYAVDYLIRPEAYTTLVDFVEAVPLINPERYDCLILHCGVVDFSPRPISGIDRVRENKRGSALWNSVFAQNETHYSNPWPVMYAGEETINLYAPEYLRNVIAPKLACIPNLLWITSNRFVSGWEGNYTKGRPANIDETVARCDRILSDLLPNVVDLRIWRDEEIKRFTIDNIHFTPAGFAALAECVDHRLWNVNAFRREQP